eukprot:357808-Chlamydomonas_euryale.AAC.6
MLDCALVAPPFALPQTHPLSSAVLTSGIRESHGDTCSTAGAPLRRLVPASAPHALETHAAQRQHREAHVDAHDSEAIG